MINRYVITGTIFNLALFFWGFYTFAYAGMLMFMRMYDTFLGDVSEWIWLGISVANIALIAFALFVVYYHLRYVTRRHIPGRERMKSVIQVFIASAVIITVFLLWWHSPMSEEKAIQKAAEIINYSESEYVFYGTKWDSRNDAWDVAYKVQNLRNTCIVTSVSRTYTITTQRDCE